MSMRREQGRRWLHGSLGRLWVGFTFASSGDGLAYGAVPLLAVLVDPHPVAVSVVAAADNLPWLLVAVPAGVLADRFDRGPTMALMNALRALVILIGAVLIVAGHMNLGLLVVVVLINAAGRAIYYSSMQALTSDLVSPHELEHANGVLSGTEAATEHLAGPIVGTTLFAVSPSIPFFADAVALVSSCLPFSRFHVPTHPKPSTTTPSSTSIWEGARYLFADRRLRVLLAVVSSLALLQGMEGGVLVLLATTEWGIKPAAYGIFLAVGAAGNLLGSVAAARLVARFGSAPTLIAAAGISGVGYLLMAPAKGWVLAGAAFVIIGLAVGAGSVIAISLRQRLTPPDLMGRVGGAWRGITWGAAPLGALAAGGLAAFGGLRLPIILAGVLQCMVALVLARPLLQRIGSSEQGPSSAAPAPPVP
jgi:MFS family permease